MGFPEFGNGYGLRAAKAFAMVVATLTFGSAASCTRHRDGSPAASREEGRLADDAVAILSHAEKVETFRLLTGREGKVSNPGDALPKIQKYYAVVATGPTLGPEFGSRLAGVFLSPGANRYSPSACIFDPGVAFRVWRGERYADLLVCFNCNVWSLEPPAGTADDDPGDVRGKDLRPVRAAVVRLVREAFADDAEVRSLSERDGE